MGKKGFSLLELLVVILIIGILAAVALPQYYKAKEKAEAVELQIIVKALHESQQRYFMVHNTFAKSFDDLDMDYEGYQSGGCEDFSGYPKYDCISNSKNVIFISSVYGIAGYALRKKGKYKHGGFLFQEEENNVVIPTNKLLCYRNNSLCSLVFKCDEIAYKTKVDHYYVCPS